MESKGVPDGSRPTRCHRLSPTFPKAKVKAKPKTKTKTKTKAKSAARKAAPATVRRKPEAPSSKFGIRVQGVDDVPLRELAAKLPTAGLVALSLKAWRTLAPGAGRLVLFATPRDQGALS